MASAQATRFGVDSATRIHLFTLLLNAQASVESLAVALEMIVRLGGVPDELKQISDNAEALVDALGDLDERLRSFLNREEAGQ